MGKKIESPQQHKQQLHPRSKVNRLDVAEVDQKNKQSWPSQAVVYIGHLPHGFLQEQLKQYFSQYGQVLGVKVGRSRKTARSKGYAFVQFKYPEVANIVADTMNGYLLLGKVLVSHVLPNSHKNPFHYSTSKQYTFINWKRQFILKKNEVKSAQQTSHIIHNLLKKQQKKKLKLKQLGIDYQYPGFAACVPKQPLKSSKKQAKKNK